MTKITPARLDEGIQEEEVSFRAPVSESTWTRVGGNINFINDRQLFYYQFNINGGYDLALGQSGLEGMVPFLFDFEIVGIGVSNAVTGTSGTTTADIHRFTASGVDAGTIFTTKPSVTTTAPANAYALRQYLPSVSDVVTSTGITLPSLSTTSFDAGDALRFDIDAVMSDAENFSIHLLYRPR